MGPIRRVGNYRAAAAYLDDSEWLNGVGPNFKADYKGINEICTSLDALRSTQAIVNLWVLEVSPFLNEIPTSHFIFMQEYFNAKIDEHK